MNETPDNHTHLPNGTARHHFNECASTNAEAFELSARGATLPAWVTADVQTGGKGRGNKTWQSVSGNLHASYVFQATCEMQQVSQLAFVAALAVRDTVAKHLTEEPDSASLLTLKWPNDVLCAGRKISGILVQTARLDQKLPLTAVIGFGLNIASHPTDIDQPATSLRALRSNGTILPTLPQVLSDLDQYLSGWLLRWRNGDGWSDVRNNWIAQNGLIGRRMSAQVGDATHVGVMKGLDPTGALIIMTDDGPEEIVTFGDVVLV